jgi:hypothetical protein
MANAFYTVWIDGLLYKLTILNTPHKFIIPSASDFQASFPTATSSCRGLLARVSQRGLISFILLSLYALDMPISSHHVEIELDTDIMAIIANSRKPTLFVSYLESYLSELQRWLSEWRIAINVSKSTVIIFSWAGRRFIEGRSVTIFGWAMQRVDTLRYLGVTLDTRLTCSPHIDQVRKKIARRMCVCCLHS